VTLVNQNSFQRGFDRRHFFRIGGLGVATVTVAAACAGAESPGIARVGVAPTTTDLPDGAVSDVVLLRTAASIEYTAIDVYNVLGEAGIVPDTAADAVARFVADHTAHAEAVNAVIEELGGEPFTCANPRLMELTVPAILAAINGDEATGKQPSDDPSRDALNVAFALETYAAETYQAFIPMLSVPELRRAAITIGGDEARHSAILAIAITGRPAGYAEFQAPAAPPQIPVAYAMPTTFGSLAGQQLVIGAEDEVGQRTIVALDSPAANTYVYDYLSC
jgi:rubrerythrin